MEVIPQAPLHPDRVTAAIALLRLRHGMPDGYESPLKRAMESALAALELIEKMQRRMGVTPELATAGNVLVQALEVVKRLGR